MTGRIGVDPPAVPVESYVVRLQRGTESKDSLVLGVDFVYLEVEVVPLRALAVGPARGLIVRDALESQARRPDVNPGGGFVAAVHQGAAGHPGIEGRQQERVRAIDDKAKKLQHCTIMPFTEVLARLAQPLGDDDAPDISGPK